MSTSADFPGNCITNVHILHDFAEIAYIVCTHTTPPSTEKPADVTSPERILSRLLNAEKQFRQYSILAALDVDKLELFTFYRKVDVVKDQNTILKKFGLVCRLNSCTIFTKGAARVLELLKPESSRVYKLFTSAVLSSTQILPKGNENAIPVGSRVCLVPLGGEDALSSEATIAFCQEWHISRVNLQVITTGQLVLNIQNARNTVLNSLLDLQRERGMSDPPSESLLYLLPTGQIARFSGGMSGSRAELGEALKTTAKDSYDTVKIALAKISVVTEWLKQKHPSHIATINETTRWIQVEIAALELKEDSLSGSEKNLVWTALMWPSNLIYVFQKSGELRTTHEYGATETDPLRFALDWYNGSAERSGRLARAQVAKEPKEDADDDHAFAEEAHFEDQFNPQIFGPPAFPASQTVYPTPPEVPITHQTPGMSSVDGLAPTPAPILHASQQDSEPFFDQEMPDIHDEQPERIATGFYDEDLFEEMPDDKFEPSADADEPNWDFFDAPGFVTSNDASKDMQHARSSPELIETKLNAPANGNVTKIDDNDDDGEFPALNSPLPKDGTRDVIGGIDPAKTSPDKMESVYTNDYGISPIAHNQNDYIGRPLPQKIERSDTQTAENQSVLENHRIPGSPMLRRRSSVFEGIALTTKSNSRDSRYSKLGKFWFDNEPAAQGREALGTNLGSRKRPSSSSSDVSTVSDSNSSGVSSPRQAPDPHPQKRTWMEYRRESPNDEPQEADDIDQGQIEVDMDKVLAVVSAASGEDPFLVRVEPFPVPRKRLPYNGQKTLMVAQILVDQTSQASLLRHERNMQLHHRTNYQQVDVSMDHNGAKAPINHATLADLTAIPPKTTPRVISLSNRLLRLKRADTDMVAKQSILPFWDIVGLQPYNESKDVTAFCIYPSSTNVAEGCSTFLSRLADIYASCNLGTHSTGRIAGLTNDGLLAWIPQSTSMPNLQLLCQRFGSSIGGSGVPADSTIVIYMISPSKDLSHYREMCYAFTILFEAFVDNSEGSKRNMELVLQIIPIDFVALPDTLAIPGQDVFLELALEVYNRVPVRNPEAVAASCGSAAILEEYRIRDPAFELNNTIVSPRSRDGPCLHLAYSYSPDKRWLTAAWSDECGLIAFTMSYCLKTVSGEKSHSKRDVFRSIWDTSNDIIGRSRVKWRLVVAYTGFYEAEDIGEWQQLIGQGAEDRKLLSRLILLSIDLNPEIFVEPPSTVAKTAQQPMLVHAPNMIVTTPQANMTSPDQAVAATPSSGGAAQANVASPSEPGFESGQDTETVLIDPTDQSWAVMLAFGINQSPNLFEIRPAGASGLLVKRTASKDDNKSLQLLGVSLIAAPRSQPTSLGLSEREAILQEMLQQYRGLTTLAVSRGTIDKAVDCVPWHIATAAKGSRVLGEAM